jgi:hypothetical protein
MSMTAGVGRSRRDVGGVRESVKRCDEWMRSWGEVDNQGRWTLRKRRRRRRGEGRGGQLLLLLKMSS